ncbi:hypothetical protein KAI52_01925 [Candidatus Parcubacteria bacterium]|nr:hypothetical protein [Candidatus Parcubacteria bacterium]
MKKVKLKKILQTFVVANELKKKYAKINNINEYKKIYFESEKKIKKYSEQKLLSNISDKYRVKRYKSCDWYFGRIKIDNTGVWPRMGNITDNLLIKNSKWSANQIYKNSTKIVKYKLNHLFRIMPFVSHLNRYMPIIVIKDGVIRSEKKYLKQKYDIDDGCHRTICLALTGKIFINAYIGIQKQ